MIASTEEAFAEGSPMLPSASARADLKIVDRWCRHGGTNDPRSFNREPKVGTSCCYPHNRGRGLLRGPCGLVTHPTGREHASHGAACDRWGSTGARRRGGGGTAAGGSAAGRGGSTHPFGIRLGGGVPAGWAEASRSTHCGTVANRTRCPARQARIEIRVARWVLPVPGLGLAPGHHQPRAQGGGASMACRSAAIRSAGTQPSARRTRPFTVADHLQAGRAAGRWMGFRGGGGGGMAPADLSLGRGYVAGWACAGERDRWGSRGKR